MRRLIGILLAAVMLFSLCAAIAEETFDPEMTEEPTPEVTEEPEKPEHDYEELVVGNPTPMDGKFFTGMWGNATSDIDVRTLVNSYYLTTWAYDTGVFKANPVTIAGEVTIQEDATGDRTYLFCLCDDLYYSDGNQITAWDYAFSVLFQAAPEIAELGGLPMDLSYLKGYEEYYNGEVPYLAGVRVIDDLMIEFTVKGEYLPYFFELFRMGFLPYPIYEIAPGCKVYDDGEGIYIGNEDPTVTEKIFTVDLLQATVMDPENGYLSHPTVGSGPYVLTSWDGEVCTFEINPYFKYNEFGEKPSIPKLRYTLAKNEDMVELLEADEFQLLNKVVREDVILKGTQLVASGKGYAMQNYPRIGLSFIVFTPDMPALQEQNVRKAIAYCMDKEKMREEYTAGYGMTMDGLIGIGQWMYGMVMGTEDFPVPVPENPTAAEQLEYEQLIQEWEDLSLDGLEHYELNVDKAVRLLEKNGWTLNENGEAFRPGVDEVRCKQIGNELVKMDLTCAYPVTNFMAVSMETLFVPHLQEAGIRLTLIPMTMKELLRSYNDKDVEDIDMFYLGDDFNIEFDPQLFFLAGDPDAPEEDTLAWAHSQMAEWAHKMCETEPTDALGFVKKWITFQEHLSDLLPLIPVYSNVYFDFYTGDLMNYDIIKYITWGDAIVPASYYDAFAYKGEEEEPEDEEELLDDEDDDLDWDD
uniref:Bacterial extracellular solute-binding proteins, family 5 Middle n=1 Tax=uncultured bacterium Contigcl_1764b TaxID=1393658 RepID=W0FSL4_9BACT|nr:bacterial extracellular solute-binding proteins, family 5 Middle [uncultured bacterium Contigcl_1764b]